MARPNGWGWVRMRLPNAIPIGLRAIFVLFVLLGVMSAFVVRGFVTQIKPAAREVMEDGLIDTAHLLAEIATDDMLSGQMSQGRFANRLSSYNAREVQAKVWGLDKTSLDLRIYITDARGLVVFDSEGQRVGQDFSHWRDVALTLRGQYGARVSPEIDPQYGGPIMRVAAPILSEGKLLGVLSLSKPMRSVEAFIARAEQRVVRQGLWLIGASAALGIALTVWLVARVRRLRRYAQDVEAAKPAVAPDLPGELGDLAQAMSSMRERLEGKAYVEHSVRALTHELKAPMTAIATRAEFLQDELSPDQRRRFANDISSQVRRAQRLVDQMLELSKLDQRRPFAMAPSERYPKDVDLVDCCELAVAAHLMQSQTRGCEIRLIASGEPCAVQGDAAMCVVAISNLIDNALGFSADGDPIDISVVLVTDGIAVRVRDHGPGADPDVLPKLGQRFISTARPQSNQKGSGLGLAIVQQIAQLHGATLRLRNLSPGDQGFEAELVFLG